MLAQECGEFPSALSTELFGQQTIQESDDLAHAIVRRNESAWMGEFRVNFTHGSKDLPTGKVTPFCDVNFGSPCTVSSCQLLT